MLIPEPQPYNNYPHNLYPYNLYLYTYSCLSHNPYFPYFHVVIINYGCQMISRESIRLHQHLRERRNGGKGNNTKGVNQSTLLRQKYLVINLSVGIFHLPIHYIIDDCLAFQSTLRLGLGLGLAFKHSHGDKLIHI